MTAQIAFKLIGGSLILGAGIFTGNALNRADKAKLARIEALISLMNFFKQQIDYYCVPVKDIFERCDTRLLSACGIHGTPHSFDEFIALLPSDTDASALSVLNSFGAELGGSFREEQLKSCEYHINRLAEIKSSLEAEIEKRKKLNRVIPFSASAAIVILLI